MLTVIAASTAGTTFEWYDFFVFGALTPIIAKNFFASLGPTAGLLAALALFGTACSSSGRWGRWIFGAPGRSRIGRKGASPDHHLDDGGGDLRHRPVADLVAGGGADQRRACSALARTHSGNRARRVRDGEGGRFLCRRAAAPPHRRGYFTSWIQTSATPSVPLQRLRGDRRRRRSMMGERRCSPAEQLGLELAQRPIPGLGRPAGDLGHLDPTAPDREAPPSPG